MLQQQSEGPDDEVRGHDTLSR